MVRTMSRFEFKDFSSKVDIIGGDNQWMARDWIVVS